MAETKVVEYWKEGLEFANEDQSIRFEVELWCRGDEARRKQAFAHLRKLVISAGGQCITESAITPILYHGVLVDLPYAKVRETVDSILSEKLLPIAPVRRRHALPPARSVNLPGTHEIEEADEGEANGKPRPLPKGAPVVALLDGLPLEHHELLEGRLIIDDENDYASRYKARQQQHGTSMASLIAHGDLGGDGLPIETPIYVRPILVPFEDFNKNVAERTPDDRLLIDIIHEAVLRIKGAAGQREKRRA